MLIANQQLYAKVDTSIIFAGRNFTYIYAKIFCGGLPIKSLKY